jgi:RNA polymerase sigma factor (TIGR02999 family)
LNEAPARSSKLVAQVERGHPSSHDVPQAVAVCLAGIRALGGGRSGQVVPKARRCGIAGLPVQSMSEFTRILERAESGDGQAAEELLPLVYGELRRLASHLMNGEQAGHTLQPTALVHEAWLRLSAGAQLQWQNRSHFFGASAEAMRRILVEHARRRLRLKRGGGVEPLDADAVEISSPIADDDVLLGLSDALEKLAIADSRKAELVKLRYFVGMTHEEAAATLGIAVPTAKQWWAYARAWLAVEMRGSLPD